MLTTAYDNENRVGILEKAFILILMISWICCFLRNKQDFLLEAKTEGNERTPDSHS